MLNYNMDVAEKSTWICSTQNGTAKTMPFTCSEVGEFRALEKFSTERDFKDCYWLVYTTEGEGVLELENRTLNLTKGTLVLLDCRHYQKYYTAENSDVWHHYWVHINGVGVESLYPIINPNNVAVIQYHNDTLEHSFKSIIKSGMQKDVSETLKINLELHQILSQLAQFQLIGEIGETSRREEMLEVSKFLCENFQTNISLNELADKYHLSKFHFIRTFKKYMGTTPYDYLLHYRITKAKELLCRTQWTTGRIGLYIGFGSESNFTAQFKKVVSISPSMYRKENYNIDSK